VLKELLNLRELGMYQNSTCIPFRLTKGWQTLTSSCVSREDVNASPDRVDFTEFVGGSFVAVFSVSGILHELFLALDPDAANVALDIAAFVPIPRSSLVKIPILHSTGISETAVYYAVVRPPHSRPDPLRSAPISESSAQCAGQLKNGHGGSTLAAEAVLKNWSLSRTNICHHAPSAVWG
jgi:hypothetical protein